MSKLNENSGRVSTSENAKKVTDKHSTSRSQIEESGKEYIESFFIGANTLKEVVGKTPLKDIMGIRIKKGINEDNQETVVLEVVLKDGNALKEVIEDIPSCPKICK